MDKIRKSGKNVDKQAYSYYNNFAKVIEGQEERKMAKVSKDTMIGELLQIDEGVAPILLNIGMHCLGCPSSQMETIEQAAMVHGIDAETLVDEINNFLESRG